MFELVRTIQQRDPARPTFMEVVLAYPGLHAIGLYRLSNRLWRWRLRAPARFIANLGQILTSIEIHPGARVGRRVFIDHGIGVVIGETAEIGNDVTIYHNVTLGGLDTGGAGAKRHPTVNNGAVIGAGAQVLGDITIGEQARIGANSVVVRDVQAGCTVIGVPARTLATDPDCSSQANYGISDRAALHQLEKRLDDLTQELETLKKGSQG
jgi:serine O-acetyltransferase